MSASKTSTSFLLVRHPKVLAKLRAEIASQDHVPFDQIDRSSLRNLPYLNNVLRESMSFVPILNRVCVLTEVALRLYPPIPVNARTAATTTMLPTGGGADRKSPILVAKGTDVAYSVYAMHRRQDLFGMDAEVYRPERWDERMPLSEDPMNAKWGYLPFNNGPRVCLGSESALHNDADSG